MSSSEINPIYVIGGIVVIGLLFFYYNNSAHDQVFLILCFVAICIYGYIQFDVKHSAAQRLNIDQKLINKQILHNKQNNDNVPLTSKHYQIYRHPKSYKYSYRIQEYIAIIDSLEFIEKYDVEKLKQVKAYCEAFFKTHFNIMLGKYNGSLYLPELLDFKRLALNTLHQLVFVLPKTSTIVNIPDLDEFITKRILMLSGLLTRYIKIAREYEMKMNKPIISRYEPPYDTYENDDEFAL
jgi:hypothetical protein